MGLWDCGVGPMGLRCGTYGTPMDLWDCGEGPMGCLGVCGIAVWHLWNSYAPMGLRCRTYGAQALGISYTSVVLVFYRLLVQNLWDVYGIPMGCLWHIYGIPMGYLWDTYGMYSICMYIHVYIYNIYIHTQYTYIYIYI